MLHTVVNLRGTSASGKTTIIRKLLMTPKFKLRPIFGALGPKAPEAIEVSHQRTFYMLGPYPIAGCDSVVGKLGVQGVIDLVEKYRTRGPVVFEALIVSSMFGAIGEWLEKNPPVIIAVLDVTLQECQDGLLERQGGNPKAVKTQEAHYNNTFKVAEVMRKKGMRVEMLKREGAAEQLIKWLSE